MDWKNLLLWFLLAILGAGAVYLFFGGNVLLGFFFLLIFGLLLFTLMRDKQPEEPKRLTRHELIQIAQSYLYNVFKKSVFLNGVPDIYDDIDLGEKWRFVFRVPDTDGTDKFYPAELDAYTGDCGEKTGVTFTTAAEINHFLYKGSAVNLGAKNDKWTPEQVETFKAAAREAFKEEMETQQLEEGEAYEG